MAKLKETSVSGGLSVKNDRGLSVQIASSDKKYSARVQCSATDNEALFGYSTGDTIDISGYVRVGPNKLQYKHDKEVHNIYHEGNKPSLTDLGAAGEKHGNHVPKTETIDNKRFLRNDNTWQDITPVNIGAAPSEGSTSIAALASTVTLGSGNEFLIDQSGGTWKQRLGTKDTTDKNVKRLYFSEVQGSGDYKELFGVDGSGEIYSNGRKVYHTGNKPSLTDLGAAAEDHSHDNATTSASGFMSNTDKGKLDGIATGANKYSHPNDVNTRHVTDTEKSNWNDARTKALDWNTFKTSGGTIGGAVNVNKISHVTGTKLELAALGASNYVHLNVEDGGAVLSSLDKAFRPHSEQGGKITLGTNATRWKALYVTDNIFSPRFQTAKGIFGPSDWSNSQADMLKTDFQYLHLAAKKSTSSAYMLAVLDADNQTFRQGVDNGTMGLGTKDNPWKDLWTQNAVYSPKLRNMPGASDCIVEANSDSANPYVVLRTQKGTEQHAVTLNHADKAFRPASGGQTSLGTTGIKWTAGHFQTALYLGSPTGDAYSHLRISRLNTGGLPTLAFMENLKYGMGFGFKIDREPYQTNSLIVTPTEFYPHEVNKISLGKKGNPWKELILGTADINQAGYTHLPNGLFVQWGIANATGEYLINGANYKKASITFPKKFSAVFNIQTTSHSINYTASCGNYGLTGVDITATLIGSSHNPNVNVAWVAYGII